MAGAKKHDELARHIILVNAAFELKCSLYQGFADYWHELTSRFNAVDLIQHWDALYTLNYLDFVRGGYCPGERYSKRSIDIEEVGPESVVETAAGEGGSEDALTGANGIAKAIEDQIPRGRHRATFCCALEIVLSEGESTGLILEHFGQPKRPREWTALDETSVGTIREIVKDTSARKVGTRLVDVFSTSVELPINLNYEYVLVDVPEIRSETKSPIGQRGKRRGKVDYVAKSAEDKIIGDLGEEFALGFERWRLRDHPDLKEKIVHTSKLDDFAGYDILSFEIDGSPRYVEVKSTEGRCETPFFVSANEVGVANEKTDHWLILRVFNVVKSPRCCEIRFPFYAAISLEPSAFRATFLSRS